VTDVVHDVAEALKITLATERVYLLSLGSHQGNAHVRWHVAPLLPGVPYERQQFHAVMAENGVLEVTQEEQAVLAARYAEDDDIGGIEVLRQLAIIVRHAEVEGVDAAKIVGIDHVLAGNHRGLECAEIGHSLRMQNQRSA
jgi:hypothetical protein